MSQDEVEPSETSGEPSETSGEPSETSGEQSKPALEFRARYIFLWPKDIKLKYVGLSGDLALP